MKAINNYRINIQKFNLFIVFITFLFCAGCESFLEPNEPTEQLSNQQIFEDESSATAAVSTLYGLMRDNVLLTGNSNGLSFIMGIYSDELDYYGLTSDPYGSFYVHQILDSNEVVESIWNNSYNLIYNSNVILEGIDASQNLSNETKQQLKGETLFIRTLANFYLVNLFGDIPYIQTTNYTTNTNVERLPSQEVYQLIINDLNESKSIIGTEINGDKTRINKMVVSAFMARVFLYMEQWENAEEESSFLINQSTFEIENDINRVFIKDSNETIWQLNPKYEGNNTEEALLFYITFGPPYIVDLNPSFVQAMEPNDLRRQNWIGEVSDGMQSWYFPYKYKLDGNTGTSIENSIVLRLSEQYLIRAEARIRQGNTAGAIEDLNIIRQRAGLEATSAITSTALLEAILRERRFELFTEHGQRWFDIKRLGLADEILSPIKSGWQSTDVHLPIPEAELSINPNLLPQNPGY